MNYSIENGLIKFGTIYNYVNDKIRIWNLYIELHDKNNKLINIDNIDMDIPNGYYTEYFTNTGYQDMKITKSANTKISTGKNLGKKNATNVLTQAINEGQSKYNLKIRAGYSTTVQATENKTETTTEFPYPMALAIYKDHLDKLKYPLFVQPKLDGIRLIAKLDKNGEVLLSSRRHKEVVGFENVKMEIKQLLKNQQQDIILDGELYLHGMNLQDISGIVRQEDDLESKNELKYYVFDAFVIDDNSGFKERYARLNELFKSTKNLKYMVLTETIEATSNDEATQFFNKKIQEGYEGAVYKSSDRKYEYSFNKEKRSMYYLKRKQSFDAEYKIIGFTTGKGKDKDCVIFICETDTKKQFNSVPNGTYEYRKELYEDCLQNFDTKYKDKYAKVYYEDLSKDGVPLRNRMIQVIRDTNFD